MKTFPNLTLTREQQLLFIDLGLHSKLGVDVTRTMAVNDQDCEEILKYVPRVGRTAKTLRQKVARLQLMMELQKDGIAT